MGNSLRNFYRDTLTKIRVNGELTEEWKDTEIGIELEEGRVNALFYADDIILIAETKEELQELMEIVTRYCKRWRCEINKGKSQVVVYGPKRLINKKAKPTDQWQLGGGEIKKVKEYKYLGLEIENGNKWINYKDRVIRKAKRIIGYIKWINRGNLFLTVKVLTKLWFGLGRSTLEYGAEIWGGEKKWEEAERLQRKIARFILKTKKNVNNNFLEGELNWMTLENRRIMLRLRYWRKILRMKKERLTQQIYR